MNKHLVAILTLGAVLGSSVVSARAVEGSRDPAVRERAQLERQEARDTKIQERDALRLRLEEKRNSERKERLIKFWNRTIERLQKLIDRQTRMSTKIAERLAKYKAAGKDVTRQEALLVTANTAIATAQTSMTNAEAALQVMMTENKPVSEIIAKARELHKEVIGKIRLAHRALVDVIVATRGMSGAQTPTPSVSPTATPTP